jgi:hypothetical protein
LPAFIPALISGLRPFEVLLLALGSLLFLTLLVLVVVNSLRGKGVAGLAPLFGIAVLMIGFPGWQRVKIRSDEIEIQKLTRELEARRGSPVEKTREELRERLHALESRPNLSPETVLTVAKAQVAVGEVERARATLRELSVQHPELSGLTEHGGQPPGPSDHRP